MSNGKKWVFVLLYTVLIFISLPFARNIWNWIGHRNAYIVVLGLYCCLAGCIYYRYRNIILVVLIALCSITIFKLIPLPVERIHFIEYGLLGWMMSWIRIKKKKSYIIIVGYIVVISILDEIVQGILPSRVFDWRDIWMNIAGGCIGLALGVRSRNNYNNWI